MAEAIGLVSGSITIVKLFHTTVQVFDIVNSSKAYSSEIHVLCSKLELERTRLLKWGEIVGLTEINGIGPHSICDSRLYLEQYRRPIAYHLNHLLQLFEKVDQLLEKHGVCLDHADGDIQIESDGSTVTATASNKQLVKGPVHQIFPHQLETLRRSIKHHQTSVPWFKKAKWAVYQGDHFKNFVEEIKDLVDGLHKILPDISARTTERLIQEIEVSEDISSLCEVQAAAIGYHDDLAAAASARSEVLSVTRSTQRMSLERSTVTSEHIISDRKGRLPQAAGAPGLLSSREISEQYTKGAVSFSSMKDDSRLLSCQIRWIGVNEDGTDDDCGRLPLQHPAFSMLRS